MSITLFAVFFQMLILAGIFQIPAWTCFYFHLALTAMLLLMADVRGPLFTRARLRALVILLLISYRAGSYAEGGTLLLGNSTANNISGKQHSDICFVSLLRELKNESFNFCRSASTTANQMYSLER